MFHVPVPKIVSPISQIEKQLSFPYNIYFNLYSNLTYLSKGQLVLVHLDDLVRKEGKDFKTPEALHSILQGIVDGIDRSENKKLLGFVLSHDQNREIVEGLIQKLGISEEYLSKDLVFHTPEEAVKKSKKKNLSISYVFTLQPNLWPEFLNLILLRGNMTIKGSFAYSLWKFMKGESLQNSPNIHWNGSELTIQGKEFNLESIEELWKETITFAPQA
jgi:hypothetical protein